MSERFEIVFAGTGSPLMNPDRCGSGTVIVAGNRHVLVDCGWGAARKLVPSGVRPVDVDVALFTHMHTDHITDFPDFFFLRWTGGARRPLRVYGPSGTRETMEGFMQALRLDIGFRLAHHGDLLDPEGARVEVTEIPATPAPTPVVDLDGLVLEAFEVDHFPVVPAFGYRATFDGRRAVLSGDTSLCEPLLAAAQGVDLLVCEALNHALLDARLAMLRGLGMEREAGVLDDARSYHIAPLEVARLAREAGVGEVVLNHLIPQVPNDAEAEAAFIAGMSEVYGGRLRVARDTQRIAVTAMARRDRRP